MNFAESLAIAVQEQPHSAPVTNVGPRIAFTLLTLAVIALAVFGMRRSWLAKSRKHADLPAPASTVPTGAMLLTGPFAARFAGTTINGAWLDRVVVHGLGTPRSIEIAVYNTGVWLTDSQDFGLWIDRDTIAHVRTARGLAGDVVEPDGMLIVTWSLGDRILDSGIRVTRHSDHQDIAEELFSFTNQTFSSQSLVTQQEETA